MRAREFTINVPITIKINGDGDPEIDMPGNEQDPELQQNPVMVSPLQQELELKKVEHGKESPVMDKITVSDTIGTEEPAPEVGTQDANVADDDHAKLVSSISQLLSR